MTSSHAWLSYPRDRGLRPRRNYQRLCTVSVKRQSFLLLWLMFVIERVSYHGDLICIGSLHEALPYVEVDEDLSLASFCHQRKVSCEIAFDVGPSVWHPSSNLETIK